MCRAHLARLAQWRPQTNTCKLVRISYEIVAFPEGRAYLGSIVPQTRDASRSATVRVLTIPQVTLDSVVAERGRAVHRERDRLRPSDYGGLCLGVQALQIVAYPVTIRFGDPRQASRPVALPHSAHRQPTA